MTAIRKGTTHWAHPPRSHEPPAGARGRAGDAALTSQMLLSHLKELIEANAQLRRENMSLRVRLEPDGPAF